MLLHGPSHSQPSGNSLILNGVNDYILIPNNSNLNQDSSMSVEAWIYPCKVLGQNFILNKDWCGGSGNNAYNFRVLNGKLHWKWDTDGCGNGAHAYESLLPAIQANQWQHVVAVHTTTSVTLYLNGVALPGQLISGSYSPIMQSPEPMRIGTYRDINSNYWGYLKGRIDEVRVWNYALSAAEVYARYDTVLVGNEAGLVAYYPMDNSGSGAGTLIPNQATLTGIAINGSAVGTTSTPYLQSNAQPLVAVDLGNDTTLCPGQQINLNVSLSGASYLWNNGTTLPTFSITQPGAYWVQVSQGDCASTDTLVVQDEVLPLDLGPDTALCIGDTLFLNAGLTGAAYLWDDGTTNAVRAVTQSGIYWVSVSRNGCSITDTIQVTFISIPVVNLGIDTMLCEGTPITLSPGAVPLNASLLWSTGATGFSISPLFSGTYWLRVGVGSCEVSDTVNVQFKPIPQVHLGADTTLCEGQALQLQSNWPGDQYLWSDGSTAATLTVSQAGIYGLTVSDDGCSGQDEIGVDTQPLPHTYLGEDTTICQGNELLLHAGNGFDHYLWSTGATSNVIGLTEAGKHWVRVENECGTASDSLVLTIEDCEFTMFIPNAFTPWRPDGINDEFLVKATRIAEYSIIIFNRWGGLIFESHSLDDPWDGTYHGKLCPSSVYYYRIDFRPVYTHHKYTRQGCITLL
ncbi:MAG TPA: gliding motility-associated C-terminal domain-containing protein [Bacteroidales bacterium]|nr:gliding motility-associated C-terminal domain-containing protein [Bacteroidales bacterium]